MSQSKREGYEPQTVRVSLQVRTGDEKEGKGRDEDDLLMDVQAERGRGGVIECIRGVVVVLKDA